MWKGRIVAVEIRIRESESESDSKSFKIETRNKLQTRQCCVSHVVLLVLKNKKKANGQENERISTADEEKRPQVCVAASL